MSFVFGTNMECLYSQPALGATITAATKQIATGTTATNPPAVLPPLQTIWPTSQMAGKAMRFVMGGSYDAATAWSVTTQLYADTAFSGATVLLAASAACAFPAAAAGMWEAYVDLTCVSAGYTTSSWYATGRINCGSAQSANQLSTYHIGNAVSAGVPTAVVIAPQSVFTFGLYTTWATAPTAYYCSTFEVWANNL
jgi:hypothetical protein